MDSGHIAILRTGESGSVVEVRTKKRLYTRRYANLSFAATEAFRLRLISSETEQYLFSPVADSYNGQCEYLDEDLLLRAGFAME